MHHRLSHYLHALNGCPKCIEESLKSMNIIGLDKSTELSTMDTLVSGQRRVQVFKTTSVQLERV